MTRALTRFLFFLKKPVDTSGKAGKSTLSETSTDSTTAISYAATPVLGEASRMSRQVPLPLPFEMLEVVCYVVNEDVMVIDEDVVEVVVEIGGTLVVRLLVSDEAVVRDMVGVVVVNMVVPDVPVTCVVTGVVVVSVGGPDVVV
jgi:hypothetical protein